jgi:hypothetical protein
VTSTPTFGDHDALSSGSGGSHPWGPDAKWRAWFGREVVGGIVEVLDQHVQTVADRYRSTAPAALGCVPWLTHADIADRLARLDACCIVVDKGARILPQRLVNAGNPFPNVLPGLRSRYPADQAGTARVVGPYDGEPQFGVGPVRAVGWSGSGPQKPLLHTKLLVLGYLTVHEIGPGPTFELPVFEPLSVWWGSANWTETSRSHQETGVWSDDRALAHLATRFLDDLICCSEPIAATSPGPKPDLLSVDHDEEAMGKAAAEYEEYEP